MSLIAATQLTAVFTALLGAGAIVTAVLAYLAFRKQAREVAAIERQVADEQELTRQQAELLTRRCWTATTRPARTSMAAGWHGFTSLPRRFR